MSLTVKVARSRNAGRGMPGIGDPGLLGTFGSIFSRITGAASAIPGPIGWAAGAVSKLTRSPTGVQALPTMGTLPRFGPVQLPQLPQVPAPGPRAALERFLPFGETGMQDAPTVGAPSGYHVNKTGYHIKNADGTFTYIPPESRWVKNRRRNPLNPRAASKAIGRIESLKRATSRFSRITIRKKCAT